MRNNKKILYVEDEIEAIKLMEMIIKRLPAIELITEVDIDKIENIVKKN